jgi:hypothetical protein
MSFKAVRSGGELKRQGRQAPRTSHLSGRSHIRMALRQKRREETLIRHGKPLRYCEDGRVVFAAYFTRSR